MKIYRDVRVERYRGDWEVGHDPLFHSGIQLSSWQLIDMESYSEFVGTAARSENRKIKLFDCGREFQ
jgi:hypothetical protein